MITVERRAAVEYAEHFAECIDDFLYMESRPHDIVYVYYGDSDEQHVAAFGPSGPVVWSADQWQPVDVAADICSLLYRVRNDCDRIRDWIDRDTAAERPIESAKDEGFLLYADLVAGELRRILEGGCDHELPGV